MFVHVPAPGAWYIDGGLRHHNPSQFALEEAGHIWPKAKRFCRRDAEFMKIEDSHASKAAESKRRFHSMLGRSSMIRTMMNAPRGGKD
jgi:hypothetical protein